MYTLGYSGLDGAIEFRRRTLPNLTEREYRLCQGMDSAAALLYKGKVIAAAAEERFVGITHTGQFPKHAIEYCMKQAGIQLSDLSRISHGFNYGPHKELFTVDDFSRDLYQNVYDPNLQIKLLGNLFNDHEQVAKKFLPVRHHDAHAASAYFMSGFDEALVLVIDGMGETDSISLYQGKDGELIPLQHYDTYASLGILYLIFTMHLGFEPNHDEYKVMGLASYGDPHRFKFFFESLIQFEYGGEIKIPLFTHNKTSLEKQTHRGVHAWLTETLLPMREPDAEIKKIHKDVAAGLQAILTQAICYILQEWLEKVPLNNLCIAGGVGLNCVANGALLKKDYFENIYVQPAAGDDGTSLGAALHTHYVVNKQQYQTFYTQPLPFYGPAFTNDEILIELENYQAKIEYVQLSEEQLLSDAAELIRDQAIIAWMQGRMEFGPRALGNRSILADPRHGEMRDRVNQAVKKREIFRPFAPAVAAERAYHYFEIENGTDFSMMLFTVNVREEYRTQLAAVTHVDGSARLQTVDQKRHPLFWKLLQRVEQEIGIPMLLNTSFNVKGQPIVCTPREAIETFLSTDLDALFIGNFKVRKKKNVY